MLVLPEQQLTSGFCVAHLTPTGLRNTRILLALLRTRTVLGCATPESNAEVSCEERGERNSSGTRMNTSPETAAWAVSVCARRYGFAHAELNVPGPPRSQLPNDCHSMPVRGSDAALLSSPRPGRTIPSFFIRNCRVDRFMPSCAAAPVEPARTHLVCLRVCSM